jgi:hypothetical protein
MGLGWGYFVGGKFSLNVCLEYSLGIEERAFLCELFQKVSDGLYRATNKQHSLGTVSFYVGTVGSPSTDIRVLDDPKLSLNPHTGDANIWEFGTSIVYSRNFLPNVKVLVHELGHYLYGLYDEYEGPGGAVDLYCVNDIHQAACLMEEYLDIESVPAASVSLPNSTAWYDADPTTTAYAYPFGPWSQFWTAYQADLAWFAVGRVSEFCLQIHPPVLHWQNIKHHASCWQTLADDASRPLSPYPYALSVPVGTASTAAVAAPSIDCVDGIPTQYLIVSIQPSDADQAVAAGPFDQGLRCLFDEIPNPEDLMILPFPIPLPPVLDPPIPPDAVEARDQEWRDRSHAALDTAILRGERDVVRNLRTALAKLQEAGRSADPVLLFVSTGGASPDAQSVRDVVADLVATGVRVFALGVGDRHDGELLDYLAHHTGGRYIAVEGRVGDRDLPGRVLEAFIQIVGESRTGSTLACFEEVSMDRGEPGGPPVLPTAAGDPGTTSDRTLEFPVEIAAGSARCTLGASWRDPALRFSVEIRDPSGDLVRQREGVRSVSGGSYGLHVVENPVKGTWRVRVSGSFPSAARLRIFGIQVNARMRLEILRTRMRVEGHDVIRVQARVLEPVPIPGASVHAWFQDASRAWSKIQLTPQAADGRGPAGTRYVGDVPIPSGRKGTYLVAVDVQVPGSTFDSRIDSRSMHLMGLKGTNLRRSIRVSPARFRSLFSYYEPAASDERHYVWGSLPPKEPWVHPDQAALWRAWMRAHPS